MSQAKPRLLILQGRYSEDKPDLLEALRPFFEVQVVDKIDDAELAEIEKAACPGAGACGSIRIC